MEISEVKVKLMRDRSDRLKAFCSVTIDREFVIRDLKIIEGTSGLFVAMPSRKITDRCRSCSGKNHLRAKFCNECGSRLDENRADSDNDGRTKLHADIAHPINSCCRDRMQKAIVEAYEKEVLLSQQPGYRPSYDDSEYDDMYDAVHAEPVEGKAADADDEGETIEIVESTDEDEDEEGFGKGIY